MERRGCSDTVGRVWACSPRLFRDRRRKKRRKMRRGRTERWGLPALLSICLFSEKCSPSCTSTMPAQNDRGYCTPNHCVVREGAVEVERARERERERKSEEK